MPLELSSLWRRPKTSMVMLVGNCRKPYVCLEVMLLTLFLEEAGGLGDIPRTTLLTA